MISSVRACLILAFMAIWIAPWLHAAPPALPKDHDPNMVKPGQIGDSGYVVPTPEINLKNIFGNKPGPQKKPDEAEALNEQNRNSRSEPPKAGPRKEPVSPFGMTPPIAPEPGRLERGKTVQETPVLQKKEGNGKPQAPAVQENAIKDVHNKSRERVETIRTRETEESVSLQPNLQRTPDSIRADEKTGAPSGPPSKRGAFDDTNRLPFDTLHKSTGSQAGESTPQPPTKDELAKEPSSVLNAPLPKKVVIPKKNVPIPSLAETAFVKADTQSRKLDSVSISNAELEDLGYKVGRYPQDWEDGTSTKTAKSSSGKPTADSVDNKAVSPVQDFGSDLTKAGDKTPKPGGFMESIAKLDGADKQADHEVPDQSDKAISSSEPVQDDQKGVEDNTPAKSFVSPLAADFVSSKDAGDYLREIAPILEELSLIMAKAPTLTVADYDPSEPGTAVFPKDIYIRMDALKRQLQILDAKTFSIIPPPKFLDFHSMIRESISRTFRACDELIQYFNNQSEANLQKVLDNLSKAKQLIQLTRSVRG